MPENTNPSGICTNDCRRTALITGGAGGIGRQLARLFARDSYDLVLVDRNLRDLEDVKKTLSAAFPEIQIMLKEQDLTLTYAAYLVHDFTRDQGIHINVLINCAGFGTYGFIDDIEPDREIDMLQLHVMTLYRMTRLYLKDMIGRDEGQIINISSISAFQPNPYFATYGASKSFVLNFSRALNFELQERKSNVKVLAVCPTAVQDTGFKVVAGMERTGTFDSWMAVTAETVALDTYRAMKEGRDMVIPGRGFTFMHSVIGRLPVKWLMRIARSQLRDIKGIDSGKYSHLTLKSR